MSTEYIGLECPYCGCKQSTVAETRQIRIRGHNLKMRIRICRYCKKRFKSREITDQSLVTPNNRGKNHNPDGPPEPSDPLDQLIEPQSPEVPKVSPTEPPASLLPPQPPS